ncbi:MAG: hypothetical protein KC613_09685 [Myxococcales bacterium]|nr:hypothetical protein [Myxococcales bacterium]
MDEDPADAGSPCQVGVGVCARNGLEVCDAGQITCGAVAGAAGPEICDQLDNDCDGQTDEDFVCPDTSDPVVQVGVSPIPVDIGQAVTITVIAQDDRGEPTVAVTVDDVPLPLDANGQAVYVPQDFGAFTVRVVVTDDAGNQTVKVVTGAARDPADQTHPTATITGPAEDSEHGVAVAVTGTADDATLVEWTLAYALKSKPNDWVEFARGDQPVIDGELGRLDPTLMLNGLYTLRLLVRDASGLRSADYQNVRVYGDAKVGLFTITYTDATISVAGMPLTVERTYDSRVKTNEDFGVGWTLDIRQGRLEHNKPIDEGWQFQRGGFLGLDQCAGASATEVKLTEFHLSESRSYTFRPVLTSLGSGGHGICWAQLNFQFVKSKGGGRAKLEMVGFNQLLYLNDGSGHIYEDFGEDFRLDQVLLTVEDGREFAFDRGRDGIFILRDQNGNQTEIRNDGVHNSAGKGIDFEKDAAGRITALVLPGGARVTYTYDANGDLSTVTDEAGNTTRFRYNRSHGLTEIIDPSGNTPVRNEYDDSGRLVAVVYPDGTRTNMDHDLDGRTEVVRDRLGHVEILTYNEDGQITRKVDKLGQLWRYEFDANGRPLSETAPDGVITRREYDADGHVVAEFDGLGRAKRRTYTAQGWLASETDRAGGVTRYAYDAAGNLITITDPLGGVTRHTYDAAGNPATVTDAEGGVTTTEYDEYGQLLREISPEGVVTRYTYNQRGGKTSETLEWHVDGELVEITTQYEYDEKNRLVAQVDAMGGRKTVEYDPRGNKVAETDASGARYTWTYDDRNNLIRRGFPDDTFEIYRYDAEDRRVATVDRGGRETRVTYDALGRVIRTDLPDGTHTERAYDVRNKVVLEVRPNGGEARFTYDAAGQLLEAINAVGDATTYTYDAAGRRTSVTSGNGHTTRYEYDAKGQQTATVFPDGTRREKRYDRRGLVIAEVDQAGRTTAFEYDGDGRLVTVIDPLGGETHYAWDEMKHRTRITDALGRVNTYGYDRLGRLVRHTLPSGRQEFMDHDLMGNLVQKVDFAGQVFRFEYDEVNQLVRRELPDGTVEHGAHTPTERRSQLDDGRGVTRWRYDALDREIERVEPDGTWVRHAYDGLGNPTEVRTAQGVTRMTYDAEGRLETVTDRFARTARYTYDGAGNRASLTLPNGVRTTYLYDTLERLVGLETVDAQGALIARYAYTLGDVGERLVVAEGHTGRTLRYTYDDLTRLVREQTEIDGDVVRDVQYTYDAVGNRLTRTVDGVQTHYDYDDDDRLIGQDGLPLSYDDNGRLIAVGDQLTQTWDTLGRLAEVQTGDAVIDYDYDVDGQRVGRTVTVGEAVHTTRYVIDKVGEWSQLLEEHAADGALLAEYTYGQELLSLRRANTERYYVVDGSQSVRALTDGDGAITDLYAYDAFGGLLDEVGDTENPHLFGGQYLDPNTGYYYMRARWYDPEAGRFTSRDPVEGLERDPQTLHRYVYVRNEPLTSYDPNGEFMVSVMVGVGIQGTLRHTYTTFLIRFLLSTLKIAMCQLKPAYADRDQAIMKLLDGMPGADLEVATAQRAIASAYRMILIEGAKIAFEMAKDYKMTQKEVDVHYGHFIAAAQCHKYNPHCRPSPALAKAKWLRTETKKKFDWQGASWDAAKLAARAMKGFKDSCEKAEFAADVTEKLWSYMPKF